MLFTGWLLSKWFLDDIVPGDTEELDLFGYEAQWQRCGIAGPAITKYKARWAPLGQCLSGSSPPATGTPGVLAAMPIPGLQRDLLAGSQALASVMRAGPPVSLWSLCGSLCSQDSAGFREEV